MEEIFEIARTNIKTTAASRPIQIQAFVADIRADSNRDGSVDLEGDSDSRDKTTLSSSWGAVFLADIDDTDRRCSRNLTLESLNKVLDDCNDSTDDLQRSPKYLAPLRTVALPNLSGNALGNITVSNKEARSKVRIHSQSQDGKDTWRIVRQNTTFTAEELKQGLVLGIDARDVRQAGGWDGKTEVVFSVVDGDESSVDSVWLRVAPVLTHHHGQRTQKILTAAAMESSFDPLGREFTAALAKAVKDAGIEEPIQELKVSDIWVQDFFEPAYMSMPGTDGPISIRVMLRSIQDRNAGKTTFVTLRDTGVGAWQDIELDTGLWATRDSYGNLETIPPYSLGDRSYPAGRIIQGEWEKEGEIPLIRSFLQAQEVQDPILLDSSWLYVGHVDEYIQFLPAKNERGWVLVINDPLLGLKLYRNAEAAGHGSLPSLSRPTEGSRSTTPTISQKLNEKYFVSDNEYCSEHIESDLQILKNETGITDEEIYRLPALYYNEYTSGSPGLTEETVSTQGFGSGRGKLMNIIEAANPNAPRKMKRQDADFQASAYIPAMVNGIVLNEKHVLTPDPWGPVIDGEDIFKQAALNVYDAVGINVTFIDSWRYHPLLGEIHCGTNTLRETGQLWW